MVHVHVKLGMGGRDGKGLMGREVKEGERGYREGTRELVIKLGKRGRQERKRRGEGKEKELKGGDKGVRKGEGRWGGDKKQLGEL